MKIISGGQVGAQLGALEAAHQLGIPTGGTAPPLFWSNKGRNLELESVYKLEALVFPRFDLQSLPNAYKATAMRNVDKAHATIVFRAKQDASVDKVIGYCLSGVLKQISEQTIRDLEEATFYHKPFLIVSDWTPTPANCERFRAFLRKHNPQVLNITGHAEKASPALRNAAAPVSGTKPEGRSIQSRVRSFLMQALPQTIE